MPASAVMAAPAAPTPGNNGIEFVVAPTGDLTGDTTARRYRRGQMLARTEKHAEALREFLWCFDEGMVTTTALQDTRLSFLLSDMVRLGDAFPAAREALVARLEAAETRFVDGGDVKAGPDYAALCMVLGREARLLATFERLPATDLRRQALGHRVFGLLLAARRYADAVTVMDAARMNANFEARTAPVSRQGRYDAAQERRREELRRRSTAVSTISYIEVLAGAGQLDAARELAGKLLAYDGSTATRNDLNARLTRAGQHDLLKGR